MKLPAVSLLQPDLMLHDSILKLTPQLLTQHGLKGLVLDVDETLVPIRDSNVSPELTDWLLAVKPYVAISLVSNNISRHRIRRIAKSLDLPYVLAARKPSRRKLRQAVVAMDLPFEQVAMVGDRLFTDVLAGNRLGMFTILVEPMVSPTAAATGSWLRTLEIWISQRLGATIPAKEEVTPS